MSINPNFDHEIPLTEAAALTKKFRNTLGVLLGGVKGFTFNRASIESILEQSDAAGVKIYLGLSGDLVPKLELVVVAVKPDEDDILDLVLDKSFRCPPFCGNSNLLNTD